MTPISICDGAKKYSLVSMWNPLKNGRPQGYQISMSINIGIICHYTSSPISFCNKSVMEK